MANNGLILSGQSGYQEQVENYFLKNLANFRRCGNIMLPKDPAAAIILLSALEKVCVFPSISRYDESPMLEYLSKVNEMEKVNIYQYLQEKVDEDSTRALLPEGEVYDLVLVIHKPPSTKMMNDLIEQAKIVLDGKAICFVLLREERLSDFPTRGAVTELFKAGLTKKALVHPERVVYYPGEVASFPAALVALALKRLLGKWPIIYRAATQEEDIAEAIKLKNLDNLLVKSLMELSGREQSFYLPRATLYEIIGIINAKLYKEMRAELEKAIAQESVRADFDSVDVKISANLAREIAKFLVEKKYS